MELWHLPGHNYLPGMIDDIHFFAINLESATAYDSMKMQASIKINKKIVHNVELKVDVDKFQKSILVGPIRDRKSSG